jgi:hypothetical protein
MAELVNDTGALRLQLEVVDREAPVRGPVQVVTEDGRTPSGRLLASAGVDYRDQRDGEWWPVVRLPALYLPVEAAEALLERLRGTAQGTEPGFAWQSGAEAALGFQLGRPEGAPPGVLLAEVGTDLNAFLSEVAAVPRRPGTELALFRFLTTVAALVRFADALQAEVGAQLAR